MKPGSFLDDLVAVSPDLGRRLAGIRRAAASDITILILGEPGTGRSTLARAIHGASPRAQSSFVEVDAGVLPPTLFESELFGFVPGAFTGAGAGSPGKVGRALGGTLVLDHVEEIPLAIQPKLLRLVAENSYAPLGGEEVYAELRFIAVGPPDLPERVRRGAFRADLFYRFEAMAFVLPPLRSRRSDLPGILETILSDLGERFGRPGLSLEDRARCWILEHDWPGNLRQLRNVLERELVLRDGRVLNPQPPEGDGPPLSLQELERRHILKVLAHTRGRQGEAAEILGISRKALWQKRRRFGIP